MSDTDDVCKNILCRCPSDIPNDIFKQYVLQLLCGIAGSSSVEPVATASYGTLAFGGISGAYATVLTNAVNYVAVVLVNKTDADMLFSLNGGSSDWFVVPAQAEQVIDLAANNRLGPALNVSVKERSGAPTLGYVSASIIK